MDWSLEQLRQELAKVTEGMGKERLRWHPEGKWCTAEILEHLYLTYKGTTKGLEHCLGVGNPDARNPTLRERVGAIAVCSFGYLPEGRQSPERARPKGLPYEQVLSLIGPQLEAMEKGLGECEQRFGKNTRFMEHPVLGPLSAVQWRRFHCVHGRHHLKQIARLKAMAPQS